VDREGNLKMKFNQKLQVPGFIKKNKDTREKSDSDKNSTDDKP